MTHVNPYERHTYEYRLWEDWNRNFFRQPVHAQIYEVEQHMREHIHTLAQLLRQLEDGDLKRSLVKNVLALEANAEELSDVAEHQYLALVSKQVADPT